MSKVKSKKQKVSTPCPICSTARAPHLRLGHLRTSHGELEKQFDAIVSAWRAGAKWSTPKEERVKGAPNSANGHRDLPALIAAAGAAWHEAVRNAEEAERVAEEKKSQYGALLEEAARELV